MRQTVVVLKMKLNNSTFLHFTSGPLQGPNNGQIDPKQYRSAERWYTVWSTETDFEAIERVMVLEGVANNVANVHYLKKAVGHSTIQVDYNEKV